jgi:phosphohistidine phosphatase
MMAIYLARHGEAEHDALTERGRAEVTRIAEVAAGYNVRVQRIEHSHKHRALQTAEILAAHLNPGVGTGERAGIAPLDDVAPVAAALEATSDLMLVGHLPFMERLIGALIAGDAGLRVFKVQAGGLICIDRDEGGWHICWALMPRVG